MPSSCWAEATSWWCFSTLHAHARHRGEHFRAHVLRGILRRNREIALLGADAVADIAAFVVGVGVGRQFDRVRAEAGVVGLGRVLHVVEDEELGFRAEVDGVADARDFTMPSAFLAMPRGSRL